MTMMARASSNTCRGAARAKGVATMRLVSFLLIGLCAGWLAGKFTHGRGFGLWGNLVIGVVGAIVGGFLLGILGFASHSLLADLITATVGAMALLAVLRASVGANGRGGRRRR
jgi:uncharacterized membrane protein YeaQ/YmgE (transglycosylase-associated protein family)